MPEQAVQARLCPRCGASLGDGYVCSCGSLVIDRPRARFSGNRPAQREVARVTSSTGGGGSYVIRQNPDGSLSCDCPGFLTQTPGELREGLPFAACKHIARLAGGRPAPAQPPAGPSVYQKALLSGLGITPAANLTNDQAYHLVADLIGQQGITYPDFVAKVRQEGFASVLPIWSVGWEFECGLARSWGEEGLIREASQAGLCIERGCRVSPGAWVLGHDGSVSVPRSYVPVELKSPKCYGAKGFAEMEAVLTLLNSLGSTVNESCGFHTHINAGYLDRGRIISLLGAWVAVERRFIWGLVAPSRRGNRYAKEVPPSLARNVARRGLDAFTDRYHSLNLCSLRSHGSLEVRLFQGTTDPRTVRCWTVLLLKLFEAAAVRGVEPCRFSDTASGGTFEDLLDLIGMAERTATAPIREAREWALETYRASDWETGRTLAAPAEEEAPPRRRLRDARRAGEPDIGPFVTAAERAWALVCSLYDGLPYGRPYTAGPAAPAQPAPGSVDALSGLTAAVRIPSPVLLAGLHAGRWAFGSGEAVLTWDRERDTLSCTCPGEQPCRHAVFAARFIAVARDTAHGIPGAPRPHVLLALALETVRGPWFAAGHRGSVLGAEGLGRVVRLAGEALEALPRRPGASLETCLARVGGIVQALAEAETLLRREHPVESQTVAALRDVIARAAGEIPGRLWDAGLGAEELEAAVDAILGGADVRYLFTPLGRPQVPSVRADGRPDSVATLSRLAPGSGRRFHPDLIRPVIAAGRDSWVFPGEREGSRGCTVTWDRAQDTLSCTCQGFRRRDARRCRHTVCVARYMAAVREVLSQDPWARCGVRLACPDAGA